MIAVDEFPEMPYIENICKIGQGASCCRYLTVGVKGWACEKTTSLRAAIDQRVLTGQFTALGDNCEGRSIR